MSRTIEIDHARMVAALIKPGEALLGDLTPESAHLLHMAVGVSGEAGELLDAIKKHAVYRKPIDRENVVEELGDLEFYMAGLRLALGITRSETLQQNVSKLSVRYAAGYSNDAAQQRADKS
jgi:NTP pyrophosphatase (non-canonical NTP hydrolase)